MKYSVIFPNLFNPDRGRVTHAKNGHQLLVKLKTGVPNKAKNGANDWQQGDADSTDWKVFHYRSGKILLTDPAGELKLAIGN